MLEGAPEPRLAVSPGRAGHTSASRAESAFFPHWVLLVVAVSCCASWLGAWESCSPDSCVLLIHRLSLDVTTPESFKCS